MIASAEKIKEKTFRIRVYRYQELPLHQNICAVVVDVSLSLIEFCVQRIARITPGKVLRNQDLPRK